MRDLRIFLGGFLLLSGLAFVGVVVKNPQKVDELVISVRRFVYTPSMIQSIVKVGIPGRGIGSGVIVKSGEGYSLVLTNRHVCDFSPTTAIFVWDYNKTNVMGTIEHEGVDVDLCLIKIDEEYPAVSIASQDVEVLDKVFAIGGPRGFQNIKVDGYAAEKYFILDDYYRMNSILSSAGISGSGVFNMRKELVGIQTIGITNGPPVGGMIYLAKIKSFLKEAFSVVFPEEEKTEGEE